MSEQWDFVPEFKADADKRGVIANLHADGEYHDSHMTVARAEEVSAEIRALADRYEAEGPATLGWALGWIADEINEALAACAADSPNPPSGG